MCPGGVVVPAGSAGGRARGQWHVGARPLRRTCQFRNGCGDTSRDFPEYEELGALEILQLQEDMERKFYEESGNSINAPAQRMKDFTDGKVSTSLPKTLICPRHPSC